MKKEMAVGGTSGSPYNGYAHSPSSSRTRISLHPPAFYSCSLDSAYPPILNEARPNPSIRSYSNPGVQTISDMYVSAQSQERIIPSLIKAE
jgi:hypothetical protein